MRKNHHFFIFIFLVPLSSAADSEQQSTLFEKQTLPKTPQVVTVSNVDKIIEKAETQSVHSESDNEGVDSTDNLNDEFEKIVPEKIDNLTTDETQQILNEKLVEKEEIIVHSDATSINIASEKIDGEKEKNIESVVPLSEEVKAEEIEKEIKVEQIEDVKTDIEISTNEILPTPQDSTESKQLETLIDEELLPREAILKYIAEASQKPPVPIQTYLWEDVKRSKEQVSGNHVCNSIGDSTPPAPSMYSHSHLN